MCVYTTNGRENKKEWITYLSFNSELKTFLSVDEFHTDVGFL